MRVRPRNHHDEDDKSTTNAQHGGTCITRGSPTEALNDIRAEAQVRGYGFRQATAMGRKGKLRKQMKKRELEDETALVICVGKRCCDRRESCALAEATRAYVSNTRAPVEVVTVGCLDICEKGPIAATYPRIKFKKHVTRKKARKLIDKLSDR